MSLRVAALALLLALASLPADAGSLALQSKLYSPLRDAPPYNGNPQYPAEQAFGAGLSVSGATAAISEREPFGESLIRLYERDGAGRWTTQHTILPPDDLDASQKSNFSHDYALDGPRLAMVVQGHQGPPLVIVFEQVAGQWQETARIAAEPHVQFNGSFGQGGVALSGDTLAIGSPGTAQGAFGAVHVFVLQGGDWVLQQRVTENDPFGAANFGHNLQLQGDRLVVGRPGARFQEAASSGVYVFERNAGQWTQQAKLTQPPAAPGAFIVGYYGTRLALDGDRLAIPDQELRDVGGSAYPFDVVRVYERAADGQWPLVASLETGAIHQGNPAPIISVALRGTRLLVGQVYLENDLLAGTVPKVYLFEHDGGDWSAAQARSPFDWAHGWVDGADEKVRYGVGFGDGMNSPMGGIAFDDRGAALVAAHNDAMGLYQYPSPGAVYVLEDSAWLFCHGFEDDDPTRCEARRAR